MNRPEHILSISQNPYQQILTLGQSNRKQCPNQGIIKEISMTPPKQGVKPIFMLMSKAWRARDKLVLRGCNASTTIALEMQKLLKIEETH